MIPIIASGPLEGGEVRFLRSGELLFALAALIAAHLRLAASAIRFLPDALIWRFFGAPLTVGLLGVGVLGALAGCVWARRVGRSLKRWNYA